MVAASVPVSPVFYRVLLPEEAMSKPMPEWPEKAKVSPLGSQFTLEEVIAVAGYERARAEAAMARLRLAVEALNMIATEDDPTAIEALRQIGPLP
jgi:hypothetical protein